ncbi:hypothetical protein R1sor_023797 [Riccia sorocarpa]|uniref:Uncharacterized protein n=1 Tax=Riccia sorocarpa TaxID=122646 RepID=A0ABD3GQ68_9MARC
MWSSMQENPLFQNDRDHLPLGVHGQKRDSTRRASIVTRSLEFPDGKKKSCDRPDTLEGVDEFMANTRNESSTTQGASFDTMLQQTTYVASTSSNSGEPLDGSQRRAFFTNDIQTQLIEELEKNNAVIRQILASQVGMVNTDSQEEEPKSPTGSIGESTSSSRLPLPNARKIHQSPPLDNRLRHLHSEGKKEADVATTKTKVVSKEELEEAIELAKLAKEKEEAESRVNTVPVKPVENQGSCAIPTWNAFDMLGTDGDDEMEETTGIEVDTVDGAETASPIGGRLWSNEDEEAEVADNTQKAGNTLHNARTANNKTMPKPRHGKSRSTKTNRK